MQLIQNKRLQGRDMQKGIVIKAECTIFGNNMQLNCKKKSKLSSIHLDDKSHSLIVTGKGENQLFKFPLHKLKSIHKKFIEQGKITVEFDSQVDSKVNRALDFNNENVQCDGHYQIFVTNACKENLEVLITQIIAMKKKTQEGKDKGSQPLAKVEEERAGENRKKPSQVMKTEENQMERGKVGRKNLFQLSKMEQSLKAGRNPTKQVEFKKPDTSISLATLPKMLLRMILAYSGIHLSQRLISKQFQDLVLKNIMNLKLKEEVDEAAFNKLAKWAVNLQGRFKHVKAIKLEDRFDDRTLERNKAKTLRFGGWKEISSKHVAQLKGLRIYCLQIPYSIKFEMSQLFGLRLVELRLKGKNISVRNSLVKDEDILYLINNLQQLRVIEVAYASTKLLCEIKKPEKMEEIRIGTLNKVGGYEDWANFRKFEILAVLSIENTQRQGNAQDHQLSIQQAEFPAKLTTLELGFNVSQLAKSTIPSSLRYLKLLGSHMKNRGMEQFFLPALEMLDISECPNLSPDCLEHMGNLRVLTSWNRNQVEQATAYYSVANIAITSLRGFTYC